MQSKEKHRINSAKIYKSRRQAGLCTTCGKDAGGKSECEKCAARTKEALREKIASGKCRYCEKQSEGGLTFCKSCKEKRKVFKRKSDRKLKLEVLNYYGGAICSCCGETMLECLQIDHINGDGAEHRRRVAGLGKGMHRWLRKNNFPAGFQVLCANCNFAKRNGEKCPHQTRKEEMLSAGEYGGDPWRG